MSRGFLWLIPLLLLGCGEEKTDDETCESLCGILVQDCAFAAYPTRDSCTQGCAYRREQGADVDGLLQCVEDAESCDPFAIAECEHASGS